MQKYILSLLLCVSSGLLAKVRSASAGDMMKVHLTCTVIIENAHKLSVDNVNNLLDWLILEAVDFRYHVQSHTVSTANGLKNLDSDRAEYLFDAVLDVHLPTQEQNSMPDWQLNVDKPFRWLDLSIGTTMGSSLYWQGITAIINEFKCELVQ
ncbi:hypothetical protein JST99_00220 [Candidatus Dependentiae bacterium]|nr:hypothetical protein [Candidatus Dependentiae bacterium]MCC7415473.1 hypothetical protein [Campylobacterota bacterium]